jgi:ABC-2 type transport system ATP-binding protein
VRDHRAADGRLRLSIVGTDGVVPPIVLAADAAGFTLRDLSIAEPTLETVFIDLTGKDLRD